jgi:signal transduction histidine kinase
MSLKSRFVSIASHEFRTPLSTIKSSTYLLQKYVSTEEQGKREKHIERIISSVNTLTDILNDFLSVGKIEEGKNYNKENSG